MKLKTGWALVLMIILAVGSVVFGAYRGWSEERARVNETYTGLEAMLQTRVESAYNVLAVAKRHVPDDDETFLRVKDELSTLESASKTLPQKARANEDLTRDAAALLADLAQKDSVKGDDRDLMYVTSYLPQMLAESEAKTAGAAYNQAAAEFNARMRGTFSGWIARLLGVEPAQEFINK